ncbi:hypothetical protein [Micromonospora inyonensis]|uniref:Uncharacterized protein n=1 Tax=Micromonospora inyonensis TaxID=47866 RepID=A0A1C6RLT4_9ACTN|nr:hypothetical protein [Micromonospora inyonensis]SCL18143.1 hypothetical protein GA0074694_2254 [Micromonospora inyonensis]
MRTVMDHLFLGLVLLMLAWPVFALAAVILAVRVAFALHHGRGARSRAGWLSIGAAASTAVRAHP